MTSGRPSLSLPSLWKTLARLMDARPTATHPARSPRAAACAMDAIGALPRPPEEGGKIHRRAKWADVDIEDDSTGSDTCFAPEETGNTVASQLSCGQPVEVTEAIEVARLGIVKSVEKMKGGSVNRQRQR